MVLTQNRKMGHNIYGRYISCDYANPAEQVKHFVIADIWPSAKQKFGT